MGGQQISLAVAIDFTASNGNKFEKESLHFLQNGFMNEYQQALVSVGNILNYYDSDKNYPVTIYHFKSERFLDLELKSMELSLIVSLAILTYFIG
jgi:hypothetical protein